MIKVELERINEGAAFDARDANGHVIKIDTSPENGGANYGVRPMQLLLMGLGGCSGIDVVSILRKQRQQVDSFKIRVEGEREPGVEPSLWKDLKVVFELSGKIDPEKARKACALSMDKYCSVAETLRRSGANLTWDVEIK